MSNVFKQINFNLSTLKSSIRSKLILSYIFIAFIPIFIVSSLTYIINKNVLINKVSTLSNSVSIETKLSIDNYLSEVENATSLVFAHDNILTFNPSSTKLTAEEINTQKKEIEDYLLSISLLQNFNDFALVYDDNSTIGKISETTNNLYNINNLYSDIKPLISNNKSKSNWVTGKEENYTKLYYIKEVNDNSIMITSIYTDELDEIFNSADDSNSSSIALLNASNYVIYSDNKDLIGSEISNNISSNISNLTSKTFTADDNLISYNTCNNGWKLINSIPENYIFKEISTTGIFTLVIALICMIFSGVFGYFLSNKIAGPIHDIVIKMHSAENGDLTVQSTVKGSDEIASLCASFNNMITNIKNLISQTNEVSNTVLDKSNEIKDMSTQSYEISDNISKAMNEMASGALEQAKEVNSTLDTMDNLSDSIDKINTTISIVTNASNEAKVIGNKSINTINELKTKNENTNLLMQNISSNIETLTNSIKEIEDVLKLINEINEQTNLLSLNASIEAARAGESGKGFAVVAEEIRKLADESKKSTTSVHNVIQNIYSNANTTIDIVKNSKTVFEEQYKAVNFTSESFKNIIESTEKIISEIDSMNYLVKEINTQKYATLESTNSIKIITENSSANTEEVLAVTEEQTASSQTLADSSDKLHSAAKSLSESLNKFKI